MRNRRMNKIVLIFLSIFNIQPGPRCTLNPYFDFKENTPVVIRKGKILEPTNDFAYIEIPHNEEITLSCVGSGYIKHPNVQYDVVSATVACEGGDYFKNSSWLDDYASFSLFTCIDPPKYSSKRTKRKCFEGNPVYEVGYKIYNSFYPTYESCFNPKNLGVIYTKYTQKPYNLHFIAGGARPYFIDDGPYGEVSEFVDSLFSREGLAQVVHFYVNNTHCLTRGHLAARTDFVFHFTQRTTFHYLNIAPQWKEFNGGNWNKLEVDLRKRIHAAGYDTIIYTGTYDINELEPLNHEGKKVEIYLHTDKNNNPVIPVPLYFYKVVYDPNLKKGTAFVGINNPFYTSEEARYSLFFCEDQCRGNADFSWLTWQADLADEGYSFCCTIPDFRRTVEHLPDFEVYELLT